VDSAQITRLRLVFAGPVSRGLSTASGQEHDPGRRRLRAAGAVVTAIFDGLGGADL
jgi:hypothetical protein